MVTAVVGEGALLCGSTEEAMETAWGGDGEHFLEEVSSGVNLERKVGILQAKKEGNLGQREEHT